MKLHFLEPLLSIFVVGLGQIVKGETKKGIILLLTFYFFLPALVYLSLLISAFYFICALGFEMVFGIILWIYSMGDALLKT